jgi:hypothetical protein
VNYEYVLHLLALLFALFNFNLLFLLSNVVCSLKVPKHKCKFMDDLRKKILLLSERP